MPVDREEVERLRNQAVSKQTPDNLNALVGAITSTNDESNTAYSELAITCDLLCRIRELLSSEALLEGDLPGALGSLQVVLQAHLAGWNPGTDDKLQSTTSLFINAERLRLHLTDDSPGEAHDILTIASSKFGTTRQLKYMQQARTRDLGQGLTCCNDNFTTLVLCSDHQLMRPLTTLLVSDIGKHTLVDMIRGDRSDKALLSQLLDMPVTAKLLHQGLFRREEMHVHFRSLIDTIFTNSDSREQKRAAQVLRKLIDTAIEHNNPAVVDSIIDYTINTSIKSSNNHGAITGSLVLLKAYLNLADTSPGSQLNRTEISENTAALVTALEEIDTDNKYDLSWHLKSILEQLHCTWLSYNDQGSATSRLKMRTRLFKFTTVLTRFYSEPALGMHKLILSLLSNLFSPASQAKVMKDNRKTDEGRSINSNLIDYLITHKSTRMVIRLVESKGPGAKLLKDIVLQRRFNLFSRLLTSLRELDADNTTFNRFYHIHIRGNAELHRSLISSFKSADQDDEKHELTRQFLFLAHQQGDHGLFTAIADSCQSHLGLGRTHAIMQLLLDLKTTIHNHEAQKLPARTDISTAKRLADKLERLLAEIQAGRINPETNIQLAEYYKKHIQDPGILQKRSNIFRRVGSVTTVIQKLKANFSPSALRIKGNKPKRSATHSSIFSSRGLELQDLSSSADSSPRTSFSRSSDSD